MSSLKVLVVLGSMRQGRMGERVAKLLVNKLTAAGHQPQLLDPATIPNDGKLIQPLHFHPDRSTAPDWMNQMDKQIQECDGILVVTAEYNCSLPPALTALMDNFPPASYRHKPAGIAAYSMGPFGGIRAAALARPFLSELGLVTVPSALIIPDVARKISEGSTCLDDRVEQNADKLVKELAWYGAALRAHAQSFSKPS